MQKFSRRLVVALETLDRAELTAALSRPDATGSPQPLLSDGGDRCTVGAAGRALDYINAQIERYGREKGAGVRVSGAAFCAPRLVASEVGRALVEEGVHALGKVGGA